MNKANTNMRNSKYTQEFRDSTIQLVMNSDKSVLQIAQDLDVNPKTIYNWVRIYKKANNIPIDYAGASSVGISKNSIKETQNDELKRLRAENKLLKQERDILKKAADTLPRKFDKVCVDKRESNELPN
jgi:transposase